MDDVVNSLIKESKQILKDPKLKSVVAVSVVAYAVSKQNKERNAAIAGVLTYLFLPDSDDDEEDD